MLKELDRPLRVEVKQSRNLLAFMISVHSLASLNFLLLPVMMVVKLLLLILVCISLYFYIQRYNQGFYMFCLQHTQKFSWELYRQGHIASIQILNSSVLTSFIIILQVEIDRKPQSLLICRDAVTAENYRQLYVALKISAADHNS